MSPESSAALTQFDELPQTDPSHRWVAHADRRNSGDQRQGAHSARSPGRAAKEKGDGDLRRVRRDVHGGLREGQQQTQRVDREAIDPTHHLLPTLGSKRLDEITGKDIEDLKASFLAKGKSAKRINNVLNVLSKILRYAAAIELLDRTPGIETLKVPPQRFDFFTPEEFEKLVASSAEEPATCTLRRGSCGTRSPFSSPGDSWATEPKNKPK